MSYMLIKQISNVWGTPNIAVDNLYLLKRQEVGERVIGQVNRIPLLNLDFISECNIFATNLKFMANRVLVTDSNQRIARMYDLNSWELIAENTDVELFTSNIPEAFKFLYSHKIASVIYFDWETRRILGKYPGRVANISTFGERIVFVDFGQIYPKILYCFSNYFNELKWKVNLSSDLFNSIPPDERYFGRDFFCWEDVLIVRIGDFAYYGLNINTGVLKWENRDFRTAILNNGKLYSIGGRWFVIVDAATGKTEVKLSLEDQMGPLKIYAISKFCMQDDILYFKDTRGFLGAFSILEQKLIWHHDLNTAEQKVEFGANEAPVVAGDKLMILDLNHVLHIFQRAN